MRYPDRTGAPEERLVKATAKIESHLSREPLNYEQRGHLRMWVGEAAHAVYEMRPDLREEGSFLRWFVSRSGRRLGLRGAALTRYIEEEYSSGRWYVHVPKDILERTLSAQ
jgi:hypothetical protein